jgi:hypothetical protein
MNPKNYVENKIKNGRPRCPFRKHAVQNGLPKYFDKNRIERWTSSGNQTVAKRQWDTLKRRASGIKPPKPKATKEIIAKKNIDNVKRWRKKNRTVALHYSGRTALKDTGHMDVIINTTLRP